MIAWSLSAWARAAIENGEEHVVAPILERLGYQLERAKTNTGLGRIYQCRRKIAERRVWRLYDQHSASLRGRGKLSDDYIVFASPSRGKNDEDSIPKLKKFLEMALPFKPVNIGDPAHGGALRPSQERDRRFRIGIVMCSRASAR